MKLVKLSLLISLFFVSTLAINAGEVFYNTLDFGAADGKSVNEVWSNPQIRNSIGGLIVINGKLFTATENKNLNQLDPASGKVAYKIKAPYGNLIYADSKFIVYGNNGDVSLLNYEKGILVPGGSFKIDKGSKEHFAHPFGESLEFG